MSKKIAFLFVLTQFLLISQLHARSLHPDSFLSQRDIIGLDQADGFPTTFLSVTFQPVCGDTNAQIRLRNLSIEPRGSADAVQGVRLLVTANANVRCFIQPLPRTLSINVTTLELTEFVIENQKVELADVLKGCVSEDEAAVELSYDPISNLIQFGDFKIANLKINKVGNIYTVTGIGTGVAFAGGGSVSYKLFVATGHNTKVLMQTNISSFYLGSTSTNQTLSCQ